MGLDVEREDRMDEVVEKVYAEVIRLTDDLTEPERRYFMIGIAQRILEGVQISKRSELLSGDVQKMLSENRRG